MQELCFLCFVCHLIVINIYMKFCEDSLNSFQVLEQRGICDRQSSNGNTRVMIFALCMSSNVD